jgi:hypothetical protein
MPRASFGQETSDWEALATALERHAEGLPHLQEQRAQLAAAVARAKLLHRRQAAQDTALRVTTAELQAARAVARELQARLRAGLKQQFGLHSPKLIEFGGRPKALPRTPLPDLDSAAVEPPSEGTADPGPEGRGDESPN